MTGYGPNTMRPDKIWAGTSYLDTYLGKVIWWDGARWIDSNGEDMTNIIVFTIDNKKYYAERGTKFKDWVKSKYNILRIRCADAVNGSGNSLIVSADGNKTLYTMINQEEKVIYNHYGVTNISDGGAYYFKNTPGANPDYSKTPVFWNGTELVTATGYNGGGDEPGGDEPADEVTITVRDTYCHNDPETFIFKARKGMTFRDLINSDEYNHAISIESSFNGYFEQGAGLGIYGDDYNDEAQEVNFYCGYNDEMYHMLRPEETYNSFYVFNEDITIEIDYE